MPDITPDDIHNIHDFDTLLDFLREKLGWRIPEDIEFEDVAYPLTPQDLDLDELTENRLGDYYQLPPFPPNQPTLRFAEDTQPWGIFFFQFNSETVYRSALRPVLRGLVERRDRDSNLPTWEHDQLLFICTTTDFQRFAFAHFASHTAKNWRRAVLSIFSWEQGDTHIRTLCEYNLPALAFPSDGFSTDSEWLEEWQKAFDVETVTDKFFADYQHVFAQVETAVEGIPDNQTEARRLWTQHLFNRLMFLRFIEKKGWLTYNGSAITSAHFLMQRRQQTKTFLRTDSIGHSFMDSAMQRSNRRTHPLPLNAAERSLFSTADSLRCRNMTVVMPSIFLTMHLLKS